MQKFPNLQYPIACILPSGATLFVRDKLKVLAKLTLLEGLVDATCNKETVKSGKSS